MTEEETKTQGMNVVKVTDTNEIPKLNKRDAVEFSPVKFSEPDDTTTSSQVVESDNVSKRTTEIEFPAVNVTETGTHNIVDTPQELPQEDIDKALRNYGVERVTDTVETVEDTKELSQQEIQQAMREYDSTKVTDEVPKSPSERETADHKEVVDEEDPNELETNEHEEVPDVKDDPTQDELATQETSEYEEPFEAKNYDHWVKLSSKCVFFNIKKFPIPEIKPPDTADRWFIWFGTLLRETVKHLEQTHQIEQQKSLLDELTHFAVAFNNWHNIVKVTPEFRMARKNADLLEVKNHVLLNAREMYNKFEKSLNQANAAGLSADTSFLLNSFFYGSSNAYELLPFYKLLSNNKEF